MKITVSMCRRYTIRSDEVYKLESLGLESRPKKLQMDLPNLTKKNIIWFILLWLFVV